MLKHFLLGVAVSIGAVGGALADGFSAMVSDVDTGIILVADQIDAARDPALMARLTTISMGIDDLSNGSLARDEALRITDDRAIPAIDALKSTALGEAGYRGPMTVLAGRLGRNARGLSERIDTIQGGIGTLASAIDVGRAPDGGPNFDGFTTTRDMARLATALFRTHPELSDEVFGPATGGLETTRAWMIEGDACLLVARGPTTGRTLVSIATGAPDHASCFELSVDLLARQDKRILAAN